MWHIILTINSVLMAISFLYLMYATGQLLIALAWKEFLLALMVFAFLCAAEIIIGAVNAW